MIIKNIDGKIYFDDELQEDLLPIIINGEWHGIISKEENIIFKEISEELKEIESTFLFGGDKNWRINNNKL